MSSPRDEGTVFRPGGTGPLKKGEDDVLLMEHSKAFLIVLRGPDRGREYEVRVTPTIIGRDDKADVVLSGDSVSRRHAFISFKNGRYFLKDMDSTNGTKLNGSFIKQGKEEPLKSEDRIELGDVLLQFFTGE